MGLHRVLFTGSIMFADDAKLFARIVKPNDCATALQQDLDSLFDWSKLWQLFFKNSKCKVMNIGNHNLHCKYTIDGQELEEVVHHKDLGIIFDQTLKFHLHVSKVTAKANKILGLIKKSFVCLSESTFLLLYKHLVRPHLEYCNTIWGLQYKTDTSKLEGIQRRATRLLKSLKHLTYEERLSHLKLPSLSHRQFRGDMLTTFQILKGFVDVNFKDFFEYSPLSSTRGHSYKLYTRFARTESRKRYFCNRIVSQWNSLPPHIVEATSTCDFKKNFDNYFKDNCYNV